MIRIVASVLVFLALVMSPVTPRAGESSSFFSSFRSICLESDFDRSEMEARARAFGFISAEAASMTSQVAGAKILSMNVWVTGPIFPPERFLVLGDGLDYGDAGVFPDASVCTMSSFKADASALSDSLFWVGAVPPAQSVQGFSVFLLEADQGSIRPLDTKDRARLEAATASGRLVILFVGGDEKTTSMTVTRLKKAVPPS